MRATTIIAARELSSFFRLPVGWVVISLYLLLTGIVFGLAPAWQMLRVDVNASLKEGASKIGGNARGRLRSLLVVVEVALAL